jgi:hypothetical protein
MATLAQGSKIVKPIIRFIMVNMCDSKNYLAASNRVWFIVFSTTFLTTVLRPKESNQPAYQAPLWMIFFVVDWH